MPQSSAALRQKAEALRLLRNPHNTPAARGPSTARPVWAKKPLSCMHGTCLALDVRSDGRWVLVRDTAGVEGYAPAVRVLSVDQRRDWARRGFGVS